MTLEFTAPIANTSEKGEAKDPWEFYNKTVESDAAPGHSILRAVSNPYPSRDLGILSFSTHKSPSTCQGGPREEAVPGRWCYPPGPLGEPLPGWGEDAVSQMFACEAAVI